MLLSLCSFLGVEQILVKAFALAFDVLSRPRDKVPPPVELPEFTTDPLIYERLKALEDENTKSYLRLKELEEENAKHTLRMKQLEEDNAKSILRMQQLEAEKSNRPVEPAPTPAQEPQAPVTQIVQQLDIDPEIYARLKSLEENIQTLAHNIQVCTMHDDVFDWPHASFF